MALRKRSLPITLKAPGESQEDALIRNENTPENAIVRRREEEEADLKERGRKLVEEELQRLSAFQKGDIAAYRLDVCHEESEDVAQALYLDPETSTLRVYKCAALSAHPCGKTPGICQNVPGCAHSRGEELWEEIIRRALAKLG
jgi:hypothetical protein